MTWRLGLLMFAVSFTVSAVGGLFVTLILLAVMRG